MCQSFGNCSCSSSTFLHNCKYSNGDYFFGKMNKNGQHGKGKYIWQDSSYFDGIWKDGEKWCGIEKRGNTYFLFRNGVSQQGEEGVDWALVGGAILVAGAAYAIAESAADSSGNNYSPSSNSPKTCAYNLNYTTYKVENSNYPWGSCPSTHTYNVPSMCMSYSTGPKCDVGKACGNTCINKYDVCHVGSGNACNLNSRSYP